MFIRKFMCGLMFLSAAVFGQENVVNIAFNELGELMLDQSVEAQRIEAKYNLAVIDGEIDLQWSNPDLNYTNEFIKQNDIEISEQLLYLSKTFEMPWIYWNNSEAWQIDLQAEAQKKQQMLNELLERLKSDYVELALLEQQQTQLQQLESVIDDLVRVSHTQEQEGETSALDEYLINASLFNLQSALFNSIKQYRHRLTIWKSQMGMADSITIRFSTNIQFRDVSDKINETISRVGEGHPGLSGMQQRLAALDKRIGVEKSRIWPNITLSGGIKKVNPDFNGYMVGISTPIPLLNWNGAQVEKLRVEKHMQNQTEKLYRRQLDGLLLELGDNINSLVQILQKTKNPLDMERNITEEMLIAYREGQWSLNDLLSMMQIHKEGIIQYTEQLIAYYKNVFNFETISRQQLIIY